MNRFKKDNFHFQNNKILVILTFLNVVQITQNIMIFVVSGMEFSK